jgi:hypothetical protein
MKGLVPLAISSDSLRADGSDSLRADSSDIARARSAASHGFT